MNSEIEHEQRLSPIDSPEAWTSSELAAREGWQIDLSDGEVEEVTIAVRQTVRLGLPLEEIAQETFSLPTLAPKLKRLQTTLDEECGIAWLRGIDLTKFTADETTILFWGICQHIGVPVPQTSEGAKVFHVRNEGLADNDPKARGPSSNKQLSFHTDRCDVIAFLCVQQAESGGDNDIVSSAQIYNELLESRPELVKALMTPYRYQRHNVDTGNDKAYYEQPVFSFCDGRFAAFLMRVLIERAYSAPGAPEMPSLHREALDTLAEMAEQERLRLTFRQSPGDIVFINNLSTLHRRTAFQDSDDIEKRRHLLRIWLSVPNSRRLSESFAPTFGSIEAGAIRGGMRVRL